MIVNTQPSAGPANDLSSAAAAASQGIAVGGRVLVTGGAGLIGSRLVAALLACGNQVTIVDTVVTATSVPPRVAQVREHPQLHIDDVDLCSVDLGRCVSGCDVVYHLAARAGVRESWGSAFEDYSRANILGVHRLIEGANKPACHAWCWPPRPASTGRGSTQTWPFTASLTLPSRDGRCGCTGPAVSAAISRASATSWPRPSPPRTGTWQPPMGNTG